MKNLPSPSDLGYFLEVVSASNLSRAAERLGISQPALTLAMQRLEQSFGVKLLIRGKTGVKATHAGQRLVSQARVLLHEWEKIRDSARQDHTEVSGSFTIGCHPSVALYSLPGFVPALLKRHPKLELKLSHDLSRRITEDVVSFRIDFGIVVNPVPHPDLVIQNLCRDEVTFWCAPGGERDVLVCDPELIQTQALLKQQARKGKPFARTISSSNLEVVASLTASGAGVGILPSRVARQAGGSTKGSRLAPLSADAPRYADQVCLVYRADAQKSRASRVISQAIVASFAE